MTSTAYAPSLPLWGAVLAMSLGIFGIVGAELLPASLLTSMAHDLQVTEGMAGQAVTVTAGVAVLASLLVAAASGRVDRRNVLIFLTSLLVVSNLLVAVAPSLNLLLLARMMLGISLGGFWALSAATMMRLVPEKDIAKALAILFGGVSAATVFAAPLGSLLGDLWGWRAVFVAAAGLGALALLAQLVLLPSMHSEQAARLSTVFRLLRRPGLGLGMLAFLLVFTGHFGFFTYLRPFLETVTRAGPMGVTSILLIFGIGTFVGNSVSSRLIERSMFGTLATMPLLLAVLAILLATLGGNAFADAALPAIWGFAFGIIPVSWSTWVTRVAPDEAESGGGLLVATANLAITIGAAAGGWIFDHNGSRMVFFACAAVLALSFVSTLMLKARPSR
ncbi:MFS transporter [Devosia sp. 1566]|uniref:MFS transporter n=1 Tax=Devosia sp. 1566 TaxID=2499144 RepID=UPI000FDCDB6E|nr:MFS transporter [Devosia sp. 1566]